MFEIVVGIVGSVALLLFINLIIAVGCCSYQLYRRRPKPRPPPPDQGQLLAQQEDREN